MNKTSVVEQVPQKDQDYEAAVDRYLIEIEHLRRDMAASQQRIERLRHETGGMLEETRQVLARLSA